MREVSLLDWSTLYNSNDPNEQYNYLVDMITRLYNKHFPIIVLVFFLIFYFLDVFSSGVWKERNS